MFYIKSNIIGHLFWQNFTKKSPVCSAQVVSIFHRQFCEGVDFGFGIFWRIEAISFFSS